MDLLMDEVLLEQIIVYGTVFLLCALIIGFYLFKKSKSSKKVEKKVEKAKEEGLFEPVSLHPYIDPNIYIPYPRESALQGSALSLEHEKKKQKSVIRCFYWPFVLLGGSFIGYFFQLVLVLV